MPDPSTRLLEALDPERLAYLSQAEEVVVNRSMGRPTGSGLTQSFSGGFDDLRFAMEQMSKAASRVSPEMLRLGQEITKFHASVQAEVLKKTIPRLQIVTNPGELPTIEPEPTPPLPGVSGEIDRLFGIPVVEDSSIPEGSIFILQDAQVVGMIRR